MHSATKSYLQIFQTSEYTDTLFARTIEYIIMYGSIKLFIFYNYRSTNHFTSLTLFMQMWLYYLHIPDFGIRKVIRNTKSALNNKKQFFKNINICIILPSGKTTKYIKYKLTYNQEKKTKTLLELKPKTFCQKCSFTKTISNIQLSKNSWPKKNISSN